MESRNRYFALGPNAEELGRRYVDHYYNSSWSGHYNEWMHERMLTTPEAIREAAKEFGEAGCDDMILFPTTTEVEQIDLLADALAH